MGRPGPADVDRRIVSAFAEVVVSRLSGRIGNPGQNNSGHASGIGTVGAMMLPYSVSFLIAWSAFLILYWKIGIPLGLQSAYIYP